MFKSLRATAHKEGFFRNTVAITFYERIDGAHYIADPLTLRKREDPTAETEPTLTLKPEEAQILIDELWDCGMRPTDIKDQSGELRATKKHLRDMRKLALEGLFMEEDEG